MATLQKTVTYSGTNSASIITDFPALSNVSAEFFFPVYSYSTNANEVPQRTFLNNTILTDTLSITHTDYRESVALEMITGTDYIAFLRYYGLDYVNASEFDYDKFTTGLTVRIETKLNSVVGHPFRALPFLLMTGDLSLLNPPSRVFMAAMRGVDTQALKKYLDQNVCLLNCDELDLVSRKLRDVSLAKLLLFLAFSIKSDGIAITLSIPDLAQLNANDRIVQLEIQFSDFEFNQLKTLLTSHFDALFDFPILIPAINPLVVKGDMKFLGDKPVLLSNLRDYDLLVDYQLKAGLTAVPVTKSIAHEWTDFSETEIPHRTIAFDFKDDLAIDVNSAEKVTILVKLFDGSVLWSRAFLPTDTKLQELHIEVPFRKATTLETSTPQELQAANRPLKGQVVEVTGKCSLKDLTVILQAKAKKDDPIWRVVGVATTDITGSFTMPYPQGTYEVAQAIVSITPDSPVDVGPIPPEAQQMPLQALSPDFLYLLVDGAHCNDETKQADDCDCHSADSKTPRLPDQKDLVGSDKFSQDLGGGTCVNLTTPNRTLSEQTYFAIVRTSDPHVANYTLKKEAVADDDGFQRVTFELTNGQKTERAEVSFDNLIKWQNSPESLGNNNLTIYQSVSVAHGHLLHYKSVLKADGYSLGDLLYSLPLAPGQKKQIAVYDWKRSLQGTETQQLTQREGLTASLINDRSIISDLSGGINESLRGQSSANTGGISAGLGVGAILGPVGAVLGVSGGYSSSSSKASQDSSRNTVQAFGETLRNSIMQSASAYRELNGTLIDTVTEGQQFSTTTEVIANHNHCHSLTILYFEVLRHYAVFQELVQVEECIFVPLVMTNFSMDNIHQWRDILAANLRYRPSNTHLSIFMNRNPLIKAFDANERVKTNWANVDYPTGKYYEEDIINVKGNMRIRVSLPRPKTKYDRIQSLPIITKTVTHDEFDLGTTVRSTAAAVLTGGLSLLFGGGSTTHTVSEQIQVRAQLFDIFMQMDANYQSVPPAQSIRVTNFQPGSFTFFGITISISGLDFFENGLNDRLQWEAYANILGYTGANGIYNMLDYYFKGRLIAEWDDIFRNDIAPLVFEKMLQSINIELLGIDLTSTSRYKGGEQLMTINLQGSTNKKRVDFPNHIKISSSSPAVKSLNGYVTFTIDNIQITYSTAHYNGILFSGMIQDSLLEKDTDLFIPISSDEKRDPRKEDKFIVNELISHLNSNLEYYNKVLWYNLDPDRRYLLLDGFHIQVYDDLNQPAALKSLASIVKNQLIGIAGNSLIFPVAAGVKVDRSYIIVPSRTADGQESETKISLFDHYRPITPPDPYRISVPTRGVFAEAVQGSCDACEKVKDNSSQDWDKFKTDEPTPIGTVTVPTPTPTDWKAAFKDFATPIVNIQNAPAAPAPGAGLDGLSALLGKSDIFKDVTGLDGNQKNAMATYLSNQENAKAFASMAKEMAMQAHNTQNADKIGNAIKDAQSSGAISKEDANKLTKDHIQQMIDGSDSKKAEADKAAADKPSLTDAAVKAADQGKSVKAQSTDAATGKSESVEIAGRQNEPDLASVVGLVPALKQENENACWATAATMMVSWKKQQSMTVATVLGLAGNKYVEKFTKKEGLRSSEKEAFISALGMVGEPPANYTVQQYITWVNTYGPLWITTDSSAADGKFSPHARILTKISGTGTADGSGTYFTFNDPATGSEVKESFADFLRAYEQMVTDNKGDLFIQIVHFNDKITLGGAEGRSTDFADEQAFLTELTANKTAIMGKMTQFVDGLRNTSKRTDITLSYGQFSVIEGTFDGTKSYQVSNFNELLNLAYGKNIVTIEDFKAKINSASKTNDQVVIMRKKEDDRCFFTARDVGKKYYNNTSITKTAFTPSTFGGAVANVHIKASGTQENLVYNNKLLALYDEIVRAIDNHHLVMAGVMSGKAHNPKRKLVPGTQLPNPEHFLLIFNYIKLKNTICFLFWDSDHFTTNFSKKGFEFPLDSSSASASKITDGFGILFGLDDSFSTAYNQSDLTNIGETPGHADLGAGYHQQLKNDIIRHRYQVYSIQLVS